MSDVELLTRAADHAEYTALCALSRWSVASNPLTDSLIKDAAALRRLADELAALRAEVARLKASLDGARDAASINLDEKVAAEKHRDDYVAEYVRWKVRAEKAEAFKAWVHAWLDGKGVPHDPEPEHNKKSGCRIGGRLQWLVARRAPAEISEEMVERATLADWACGGGTILSWAEQPDYVRDAWRARLRDDLTAALNPT